MKKGILKHTTMAVPEHSLSPLHDRMRSGSKAKQKWKNPRDLVCPLLNREYPRRERWLDLREDESIAIEPVGVLGVEGHELVEEHMGGRCHAHRGTWVTRVGLEGGIDLYKSRSVSPHSLKKGGRR